jgi:pyridoxine 4-dehydrogenase
MGSSKQHTYGGKIKIGGDTTVRRLGFGAMRITGSGVWGPPPDRAAAVALIRHVVDAGVDFIDTADSYGPNVSEEIIADALGEDDDLIVIATKAGFTRPGPNQWVVDARPERLRECVEGSLRRLRRDCIDLLQLHRIDPKVPVAESLGALVDMQDEGKIRHIGLSEVTVAEYEEAQETADIVSVQNRYNVDDRSAEEMLEKCEADGIVFLPWFPLGGKGTPRHAALETIAAARGATASQIAIAWLLTRSKEILPIPGTSSLAHFDENLAAGDIALTPEEMQLLA